MSEKIKQVLDIIKTMSVWEFNETTSALEKEFDIVARPPEAIIVQKVVKEEAQTEFDVIMTDFIPTKKIRVIKEARTILGTMLKETKDLVEAKNLALSTGCNLDEANRLKKRFEEIGCTIIVK